MWERTVHRLPSSGKSFPGWLYYRKIIALDLCLIREKKYLEKATGKSSYVVEISPKQGMKDSIHELFHFQLGVLSVSGSSLVPVIFSTFTPSLLLFPR